MIFKMWPFKKKSTKGTGMHLMSNAELKASMIKDGIIAPTYINQPLKEIPKYPQEGGLKAPVRSYEDTYSVSDAIKAELERRQGEYIHNYEVPAYLKDKPLGVETVVAIKEERKRREEENNSSIVDTIATIAITSAIESVFDSPSYDSTPSSCEPSSDFSSGGGDFGGGGSSGDY